MENALPEGVVQELERLLDAERAQQVEDGVVDRKGFGGAHASGFSQANTLQTEPSFQHMVTNVRVLPKVVDIMGQQASCCQESPPAARSSKIAPSTGCATLASAAWPLTYG